MASLGLATGVTITSTGEDIMEAAVNTALEADNASLNSTSSEKLVTGTPSCNILVHNMFDKDEETDCGWPGDIKEEFVEEASNYGTIATNTDGSPCVIVMHDLPGGMVYSKFENVDMAKTCAEALSGRWFDKRQLRVEYVDQLPQ